MNHIAVDIYRDFECIAGACPNTCCAGWRIDIDAETYRKMKEKEEQLGVPARDWLIEKDDKVTAKLNHNRCYMLDENNLCRVVRMLGPEYLSDVCRLHPRRHKQYGDIIEGSLIVSCPEVLSMLMERPCVQFDFSEDNTHGDPYPYYSLYFYESKVRSYIMDILQNNPDITLTTRLFVSFQILEQAILLQQNGELSFEVLKTDIDRYSQRHYLASLDTQLHNIVKENSRYRFLQQLLTIVPGSGDERFNRLARQTISYFNENDVEVYLADLVRFRRFTCTYDTFYTNYWVYRIFLDLIATPDYESTKDNLLYIAAEFCLFQTFALVANAKQCLDRDEYIYMISYIARIMEHNDNFRRNLTTHLQENDSISAAGLLTLILV